MALHVARHLLLEPLPAGARRGRGHAFEAVDNLKAAIATLVGWQVLGASPVRACSMWFVRDLEASVFLAIVALMAALAMIVVTMMQ